MKTPWQSLLAVLALACAMTLVSAMAGLWSDLNLRSTPGVIDDRGLITLGRGGNMPFANLSASAIRELGETSQTLQSISGGSGFQWLSEGELNGRPIDGRIEPVLPGYFETLQPRLVAGRGLDDADHANEGAQVLVISHDVWQSHFDGDRSVIGQQVRLDDVDWQVVGIADPAFRGPGSRAPLLWLPYRSHARQFQSGLPPEVIDMMPFYTPVLRARPGVGLEAVGDELRRLLADLPSSVAGGRPIPVDELFFLRGLISDPAAHQAASRQVALMLAAALLIAVVAAFNVGIFLLARAPGRRRELALRQALGAGRRRLALQLVVESGLLVGVAMLIGVLGSLWLAAAFKELPFLARAGFSPQALSAPVLAFAAGLAGLMTVLVALVPMGLVRRRRLSEDARQTSARPGFFQHAAGLVQLGLAGAVGAAALGFLAHLWLMENRDLGLSAEQVTRVQISIEHRPGLRLVNEPTAVGPFRSQVRDALLELPGVQAVGFMAPLPGEQSFAMVGSRVDGVEVQARVVNLSPGTLEVLRIPLLHGRDFEDDQEAGVIINRRYAETVWGETDVVGRFIYQDEEGQPMERGRIIGVVDNVVFDHPDETTGPMVFTTTEGFMGLLASILIRGQADPELIRSRVEPLLALAMDELYVAEIQPLSEQLDRLTRMDRARAGITALFGAVIVLLAGFGFFAMQRFLVDSGQRETAVRMALGAGPRQVRREVLGCAFRIGLPGLALGSLLGLILVAWLGEDLISRSVSAPLMAAITAAGLAILLVLASLQPALRAARTQPGPWLRED
ncbi:MAG: FtsX-like permease family protein [Wenzhouxiangella sp.]